MTRKIDTTEQMLTFMLAEEQVEMMDNRSMDGDIRR